MLLYACHLFACIVILLQLFFDVHAFLAHLPTDIVHAASRNLRTVHSLLTQSISPSQCVLHIKTVVASSLCRCAVLEEESPPFPPLIFALFCPLSFSVWHSSPCFSHIFTLFLSLSFPVSRTHRPTSRNHPRPPRPSPRSPQPRSRPSSQPAIGQPCQPISVPVVTKRSLGPHAWPPELGERSAFWVLYSLFHNLYSLFYILHSAFFILYSIIV